MSSTVADPSALAAPRQNWVIAPLADGLFILFAPLISLAWAIGCASWLGTGAVLGIFAVANVAHHLPTFIRIYGDRDLLQRFRWSLLLGPVLPFSLVMCVVAYVVAGGHPIGNLMYLAIILVVWDPWHFLMQHYGFMRIYDRSNPVPRALASRMDLMISAAWFVYIMAATLDWLPDLLYDTHRYHGLPLPFLFGGAYPIVQEVLFGAALAATLAYGVYLAWCRTRGWFVSPAKVVLLLTTFGVMWLTYVPNPLIERLMPGWNFTLGFAVIGMVHVTQYLAIVWKYNRVLCRREGAARPGAFEALFRRGGIAVAAGFVLVCGIYGFVLADGFGAVSAGGSAAPDGGGWLLGVLFALAFTSTLLHYYYDGFIWKLRHRENQANLEILPARGPAPSRSWWDGVAGSSLGRVVSRQLLYFGLPITLLSVSFWLLQADPLHRSPIGHVLELSDSREAEAAIAELQDQLEVERAMLRIRPRAKHYTYQADLLYMINVAKSWLANRLGRADEALREERSRLLGEAIASLEKAVELGPPYGHSEDPGIDREALDLRLREWRSELRELEAAGAPAPGAPLVRTPGASRPDPQPPPQPAA